jgi:hypothetical protein
VLITGPQSFEQLALFATDDEPATIKDRIRETIEED